MWKSSKILVILIMILYRSSGHCVPGSDWKITGLNSQDVGANSYTTAYLNITYIDPETKAVRTEKSEVGKFGDGKVGPASGMLIHVTSLEGGFTGCASPLRSSYGDGSLPREPWIALVKRGQCNFEVKVENALKHNASAILVYNDRESPTLDKMKLTGNKNISAVFTYKWKGEQLVKLINNGSKVSVHLTIATHCTRPNGHVNRTSVLFVSISFVVLMLTSLAWLVFYYVQRFRYLHAKDRLSRRLCNAAKKALSKIPTKEIQQEDREVQGEGECCAVCIEPYKVTDDLRILPCRHEFHKSCIDPWLLEHRTCPMCKMNILKHYGLAFSSSQESVVHVELQRNLDENVILEVPSITENVDESIEGIERQTQNNLEVQKIQTQNIYSISQYEGLVNDEWSNQSLSGNKCEKCLKCGYPILDQIKRKNNSVLFKSSASCCISQSGLVEVQHDIIQSVKSSKSNDFVLNKNSSPDNKNLKKSCEESPEPTRSCKFPMSYVCNNACIENNFKKRSSSCSDIDFTKKKLENMIDFEQKK